MRLHWPVLLSLTLLLSACQGVPRDEGQIPLASLESGARVVLDLSLGVAAERNRIYFQAGHPVVPAKLDASRAYCALEMAVTRDVPWEINETDFVVAKVRRSHERLADGVSARAVVLVLRSRAQPEVDKMVCGRAKSAGTAPVTIAEWRATVGPYFRLR
jgi:hypothetical protein